jgi:hypothetical protein
VRVGMITAKWSKEWRDQARLQQVNERKAAEATALRRREEAARVRREAEAAHAAEERQRLLVFLTKKVPAPLAAGARAGRAAPQLQIGETSAGAASVDAAAPLYGVRDAACPISTG